MNLVSIATLRRIQTLAAVLLSFMAAGLHAQGTLSKPLSVLDLPVELREISGLTEIDDHTVACLQDEAATLYLVNLSDGRIVERHPFGPPGDMEGLTRVGNDLFALRSDGLIYRITQHGDRYVAVDSFNLMLAHRNIEGLGYDPVDNRVLVAPKDNLKGGPDLRDKREVFAFDPITFALQLRPALTFSVKQILRAAKAAGVDIPLRTTDQGKQVPRIKFRMSSVAVEPATGHYFILSAVDQTLLVLDRNGGYKALYLLDEGLLPKPEGITFLPDGDLLISTEGKESKPRIVRFRMAH
ncbi:MAG: hypothetical protein JST38_19905 [Bacteroidetes bacterium]|nr:hypothetical protein [Bacteroidota bacterium]